MKLPQETSSAKPESAEAHQDLGNLLLQQGKIEAAIASYQTAIDLDPKSAIAHNNLGNSLVQQGKIEAAIASYQTAIDLDPKSAIAHNNLGNLLVPQGEMEAALASYETALRLNPNYDLALFGRIMAQLPVIYSSEAEIKLRRSNYQRYLQDLADSYQDASPQKLVEAAVAAGSAQPFYLAYQGLNDRSLQETYGEMICQLMASRYPQWCQPLPPKKLVANQKIRIGIVSGFFNHHSVWKIPLQGWMENLDRSEFELFGYYTGRKRDPETVRAAAACDRFYQEFHSIPQWASQIVQDKLDVLIFPEFGMDGITIKLGCLRLAPVQVVFGGHPETSGLPTMDYHLSSDLMESANAQSHYTEQLIRLPNLAVCYQLIPIQPEARTKQDLGMSERDIMFWCCQSLYKYLPQHDDVFPRIAQQLDNAKFVFIELPSEVSTNVFRQRLARAFGEFNLNYQDYCLFLPRLNVNAFAGTTAIADVFLDNIGWSGNNTTMESTAFNLPIVTLPGEMMRSRHTMAILTMMGIEETIATNKEQYVQIAVHLGQDQAYRHQISQKIARNKHKLYGDLTPVRALENFLLQVLNKPRRANSHQVGEAFQLAEEYYHARRLDAAQQQYLKVLETQSDHGEALYRLGAIAQKKEELATAEKYFRDSVKAQPDFLQGWFSLGNLAQSQGQFSAAEAAYRQALSLRPDSAPICNNLGYVLQQQDKWAAAADYYQQALELMPNCTEAEVNLGNARFAQGKLSSEQQIHYAELNYKLGLGRQRVGDWHTAEIYFCQAISMQSDLIAAHYYLGLTRQLQGKLGEARDCYQQVLQLNPDFGIAYYNLGKIEQDQGNLEQATANFKQGLKLINPNYAQALESETDIASFAEDFTIPQIPQGEVIIAGHTFPAIPLVTATKRPFCSVVIPVVNRPEYFPECLASVLAQWTSQEEMEIIVLDNGSNPPQWQIPDTLGRGIIRYYRFLSTISLQENWNTAVSLCRGQWIHLLHHDDYVLPGFYSRFKTALTTCPDSVEAAFTGHQVINEARQILHTEEHGIANYRGIVRDWIQKIGVVNTTSPPSIVIKRSAYEKLGGYKLDILYTCDWELYKRIASFCDWWYEPGILAHYRQQENSITMSENTNGASGYDHLRGIEISQSYLPPEHCAEITAKARVNYFGWCLERAIIPLQVGNLDGALQLIQAAIAIDNSTKAIAKLSFWLQQNVALPLVKQLALREISSAEESEDILTNLSRSIFYSRTKLD